MNIVFVHNNYPGQFVHLAPALAARGHKVWALGAGQVRNAGGVPVSTYNLKRGTTPNIFPLAIRYEADAMRGLAAAQTAQSMAEQGVRPDLIVGHCGWGETLFLKDVWPNAKQLLYAEFFTAAHGLDVNFDPEFPSLDLAGAARVRAKNGAIALALATAEAGLSPTQFQRDTHPEVLRPKIHVAHDGIDTTSAQPRKDARLAIPNTGLVFAPGDEVITHVNRNMEPLRGIHVFLRSLPKILAARPNAHAVIVGGQGGTPYGASAPEGKTWLDVVLDQLGDSLDRSRVHFLGRVPRATYLDVLAVSAAHIYYTYPFPLSWSLLEAMSAECLVIASNTAPLHEAITDTRNGRLLDFFDIEALSNTTIEALTHPDRFRQMRAQARTDALARYDLKTVCLPRMIKIVEGMA
jgi:glycosyltransferase involved in cell wall biosynthesis